MTTNNSINAFPITPYLVGPSGTSGYDTVQSALDATTTGETIRFATGGITENLTINKRLDLTGCNASPLTNFPDLDGNHSITVDVAVSIRNMRLTGTGTLFSSSVAGTNDIVFEDCYFEITNGEVVNIPNWVGNVYFINCTTIGTNNGFGVINGPVIIDNCDMGDSTGFPLTAGAMTIGDSIIKCPVTTDNIANRWVNTEFQQSVTLTDNSQTVAFSCYFNTVITPAIVYNTTGNSFIIDSTVSCASSPAISGAGAGTLTLGNVFFAINETIAGTVTVDRAGLFRNNSMKSELIDLDSLGAELRVREGADCNMGQGTFAAGTFTIAHAGIEAASRIFLSVASSSGTARGTPVVSAINAGVDFTINSVDAAGSTETNDTSTINWLVINPS